MVRVAAFCMTCTPLLLALEACAGGPPPVADPEIAQARALLASGDAERAQSEFDRVATRSPESFEAWIGSGDSALELFRAAAADPKRGNALLYLQDAKRSYERAAALKPRSIEAKVGIAAAERELGDIDAAAHAAQEAVDSLRGSDGARARFDAYLELGRCRAVEYQQAAKENRNPLIQAEAYGRAQRAFDAAAEAMPDRAEPSLAFAAVESGRGALEDALKILVGGAARLPESTAMHQAISDNCIKEARIDRIAEIYDSQLKPLVRTSPTTAWFAGVASMLDAERLRAAEDLEASSHAYDTASERLQRSRELRSEYEASAKYYEAMSVAGKARILFERQRFSDAAAALTRALSISLDVLDRNDGLGISPKRTSLEIGGEYFKAGELATGAELFESWLKLRPDDADWLNNAGLMRRDLGERLQRDHKASEAKQSFERSYAHYQHLADLRPDEPRVVNDAALILLYHLDRDLDRAERMFRKAIELGEAELQTRGDRPEPEEGDAEAARNAEAWDYFAEATGDACQNLALLLWKRGADSAEIRKHVERSLQLDPRKTRAWIKEASADLPASGPAPKWDRPLR